MVGETLGRYRIIEKIGSGGMGEVYRAHDDQLDRDVALKVLPAGALADDAARKLFRKEAQTLAKLNHQSIATIHEFGSQDGVDFLVMELILGKSLKEVLKDGPVPENQVQRLGLQLTEGLAAAHEHGVIHRDLKPANIMITSDGRLKILDFGLAKLVEGATALDLAQSSKQSDAMPGTLPYMAPEQLRGGPIDACTDVYATGAVLYETATGQRPFPETNAARLIESILHQTPRRPCELNRGVSSGLQAILLRALEKDPENRYRAIQELHTELEQLKVTAGKKTTSITLELSQPSPLEIAHVLFVDLVQYSMLPMEEQRLRLCELQKIVRNTTEFIRAKSADQLITVHSGDGMALAFFGDPEAPLRCAVELSRVLSATPEIKLRMGINTGPVYRVADINADRVVSGGGINLAQRVMDCGDAGHILLSKAVADVLMQLSHWSSSLHDLGEVEVKHRVPVHVFNFYMEGVGNPAPPSKLKPAKASRKHGAAETKRAAVQRSASGPSRREKSAPKTPVVAQPPPSSAHTHTRQVLPAITGRRLGLVAATILVVMFALLMARIRGHFFSTPTKPTGPAIKVPTVGKSLALFPFGVQGDVTSIVENLNNELSRKFLALPGMSGLVSTTATRAVAAEGLIPSPVPTPTHMTVPVEEIAGRLGVNHLLWGTVSGSPQKFRVRVAAENVATGDSFTKEFVHFVPGTLHPDGPTNLKALADQIYGWAVQTLNLAVATGEVRTPFDRPSEELMKFDFYLKSYTVTPAEQRPAHAKNALQFYEDAVSRDSRSALAWVGLARAKLAMFQANGGASWSQDSQAAAQHAETLARQEDLPAQAHGALGEVYRETGKTDQAYKHFRQALMLSPNDDLWKQLGRTYEMGGDETQAIIALENAVTMNPRNERDYNALGMVYYTFGNYGAARIAFRQAIEINPDYINAQLNLGNVCFQQARYDEAIVEYEKILRLGPPNALVYGNLGVAYLHLKRHAEAVKMLEHAAKMKPDDELIAGNLGDAYRASGLKSKATLEYARAIVLTKKQMEANPNDAEVLGDLAVYYAKSGDDVLADHYIRIARSIDAASPDLLYNEAIIRGIAKQPTAALESLRAALEKGYSPERAKLDPDLESLRAEPAFGKLFADASKKD
jgi:serine/threonine protein kinase/Flp pilus assembly protein TadD